MGFDYVSASISAGVTGGEGVDAGFGGILTFAATSFLSSMGFVVTLTFFWGTGLAATFARGGAAGGFAAPGM